MASKNPPLRRRLRVNEVALLRAVKSPERMALMMAPGFGGK